MDTYSAMMQERRRRDMKLEAEMNRFEQEISSAPIQYAPDYSSGGVSAPPVRHFIPHSIQRQLPARNTSHSSQQAGAQYEPIGGQASYSGNASISTSANGSMNKNKNGSNIASTTTTPNTSNSNNQLGYTVTPMGMPTMTHPTPGTSSDKSKKKTNAEGKGKKQKKSLRMAGGQIWEDASLTQDWNPSDFRIFCGDLGNDVTDEVLTRAFNKFGSFMKARVIRDKRSNKTKGYGFVSFKDPQDFIRAMREMNGKYVGSRPIKLRKSTWKDRNLDFVRKKNKEKSKLGLL